MTERGKVKGLTNVCIREWRRRHPKPIEIESSGEQDLSATNWWFFGGGVSESNPFYMSDEERVGTTHNQRMIFAEIAFNLLCDIRDVEGGIYPLGVKNAPKDIRDALEMYQKFPFWQRRDEKQLTYIFDPEVCHVFLPVPPNFGPDVKIVAAWLFRKIDLYCVSCRNFSPRGGIFDKKFVDMTRVCPIFNRQNIDYHVGRLPRWVEKQAEERARLELECYSSDDDGNLGDETSRGEEDGEETADRDGVQHDEGSGYDNAGSGGGLASVVGDVGAYRSGQVDESTIGNLTVFNSLFNQNTLDAAIDDQWGCL